MSDIQTIFGLIGRQVIEPQYVDVKLLHDETAWWRARTRGVVTDIRLVKRELAACRCLIQRRQLTAQLVGHKVVFTSFFGIYRQTRRVAWEMHDLYLANLERRAYKVLTENVA
jgi:hypothetical protein